MDEALRREVDVAVEEFFAANRAVLHAGRTYFGPSALTPHAREAWQRAMERAARAADRIRQLEARVEALPEARGYLKGRLVAPAQMPT